LKLFLPLTFPHKFRETWKKKKNLLHYTNYELQITKMNSKKQEEKLYTRMEKRHRYVASRMITISHVEGAGVPKIAESFQIMGLINNLLFAK